MKLFSYYSAPRVPARVDYFTFYVYSRGKCVYEGTGDLSIRALFDRTEHLKANYPDHAVEIYFDKELYTEACAEAAALGTKLHKEFKEDLLADGGVSDHPKADLLWQIVWSKKGHIGYEEIYNLFSELVQLIQ